MPSLAMRPAFFAALATPFARSQSIAASRFRRPQPTPSAFKIPAPVRWRKT